MTKVYIRSSLESLDHKNWPRMQAAAIDRVLGSIDVLGHGVEDGIPYVEVPGEAEVQKLSCVLSCTTEKTEVAPELPVGIEAQLADIKDELLALRTAFENANLVAKGA